MKNLIFKVINEILPSSEGQKPNYLTFETTSFTII